MQLPAAPTLLLAAGGMALVLGRWVTSSRWYGWIWLAAVAGAGCLLPFRELADASAPRSVWTGDAFAIVGQATALLLGSLFGLGCFTIPKTCDRTAERYGFLSVQIAAVMLVSCSNDLITLALAVEVVQITAWALRRVDQMESLARSSQSPLDPEKIPNDEVHVWLGIIASCCLWIGVAWMANMTGTTHFDQIRLVLTDAYVPDESRAVIGTGSRFGMVAIGLMIAGLGSRIGLVPWQLGIIAGWKNVGYWTMGCVLLSSQLTGVLSLARLCGTVWAGYRDEILVILLVVGGLTSMASASLAGTGLIQGEGRIRRWTISLLMMHGAWLIVGVMATVADLAIPAHGLASAGGQPGAMSILLFSLGCGQVGLAGVFLTLAYFSRNDRDIEFFDELLGLGSRHFAPAVCLLLNLASLIGHPPLAGFWSNWLLIVVGFNVRAQGGPENSIPHAGLILLLICVSVATFAAACLAIRLVRIIWLEQSMTSAPWQGRRSALITGCATAALLTGIGLYPAPLLRGLGNVRQPATSSGREGPAPGGSNRGTRSVQREPRSSRSSG